MIRRNLSMGVQIPPTPFNVFCDRMKITICGSVTFVKEMMEVKERLENLGHKVLVPLSAEINQNKEYWKRLKAKNRDNFLDVKGERMIGHFNKIKSSDAVLILNYEKNGKKNYIGGNTFIEMAVAFEHDKKIFLINPIPKESSYIDEIEAMRPFVLNDQLGNIK
jgi:diphthamide synthase subunit DPH2